MGNNLEYTIFEDTVLALYDSNVLTLEVLDRIGNIFKGMSPDQGGADYEESEDGLTAEDIVIKLVNPGWKPNSSEEYPAENHQKFREITEKRWKW